MTVKIVIRRKVPKIREKELLPLIKELRIATTRQAGYISGETLRKLDAHDEFLIISTWQSSNDWERWMKTDERRNIQDKVDSLLGGATQYEIFHYGFTE